MGFLDHSTNNVIIDAALTNKGRQFLARNDGSFSISKFALCDDEVDYTIIKKFGRAIGKEKISKNTIVMEAQTTQQLAMKFKCLSNSNPVLLRLPSLKVTSLDSTATFLSMTRGQNAGSGTTLATVQVEQTISQGIVDTELVDNSFTVTMNDRFLTIPEKTKVAIDSQNRATYLLTRGPNKTVTTLGAKLQFSAQTRALTDETFNIYGNYGNKAMITTMITIVGNSSGATLNLEVQISKT